VKRARTKHSYSAKSLHNEHVSLQITLCRLEYSVPIPWPIIALPLWASMVGEICDIVYRLRLQWYTSTLSSRQQLMLASDTTTIMCLAAALLTITLRLSSAIPASVPWTVVLLPLWTQALVTTLLCCVTPVREDVSNGEIDASEGLLWAIGAANVVICGVQPMLIALKVCLYIITLHLRNITQV
jgi:hypothetical protein